MAQTRSINSVQSTRDNRYQNGNKNALCISDTLQHGDRIMALSNEDLEAIQLMIATATTPTPTPTPAPAAPDPASPITIQAIQDAFKVATEAQQQQQRDTQAAQNKKVMDTIFDQNLTSAIANTPYLKDVLHAKDPVFGVTPLSRINILETLDERMAALTKVMESTAASSTAGGVPIVTERQQQADDATETKYKEAQKAIITDADIAKGVDATLTNLMDELGIA
jgi:hypothetical protein